MSNVSTIKNLDVRTTWTGLRDEPIQINISITINGQPETCVTLLDITDDFVEGTLVQSVQKAPSTSTTLGPKAEQLLNDFSGDTLIASDAREFLDTSKMQEKKIRGLGSDYIQSRGVNSDMPWPNIYDLENDETPGQVMTDNTTWPTSITKDCSVEGFGSSLNISSTKDPLYLPQHTPCGGNYMASEELNTPKQPRRLFPLVRHSLSPRMAEEGPSRSLIPVPIVGSKTSGCRSRSTSHGTVEVHRMSYSSPTSSYVCQNESISRLSRSTTPSDSSTPRRPRTEGRRNGAPTKPPWRSPNYQDFAHKRIPAYNQGRSPRSPSERRNSPQSKFSLLSDEQYSRTNELLSMSIESSKSPLESSGSENSRLSRLAQRQFTHGRASGRRLKPKAKDERLNHKNYGSIPLFARSCLDFSTASLGSDGEALNDVAQCTANPGRQKGDPFEENLVHENMIFDCPSYIDRNTALKHTRLPFPDIFPRVWLRMEELRRITSVRNSSVPITAPSEPLWANNDGKVQLMFPQGAIAGIYEVELGLKLNLSKSDNSGWKTFKIAGLPSNGGKDTTGGFELVVEPKVDPSALPEIQYDTSRLLDARALGLKELLARFRLLEPLILRIRQKEFIHIIDNWNSTITLHTLPEWSINGGTKMKHRANLTFELPDCDLFAETIQFSMIVKYGPREGSSHFLGLEGGPICLPNSTNWLDSSHGPGDSEAEITIIRSIKNLTDPVELLFTLNYSDKDYITTCLPKFRPKLGNVLMERIVLLKTSPPLFVDHLARGHLNTWRIIESCHGGKRWILLDRLEVSPLFPEGLKDAAMVRIRRLSPVHYEALESSVDPLSPVQASNVIKELEIRIEKVFEGELECRMSLEVQVGSNSRLLTIDDHDWIPSFFVINGTLATEKAGEWRENEEGYKTLFKSSSMDTDQTIKLEMHWKELVISDEFKDEGEERIKVGYKIPRIVDKGILGGTLQCRIDGGSVILNNGKKETSCQYLDLYSLDSTRLPSMQPGYSMSLSYVRQMPPSSPLEPATERIGSSEIVRFSRGFPLSRRIVRFEDEEPESSSEISTPTIPCRDPRDSTTSDVSSALDENPPLKYEPRIQDLVLFNSQRPLPWIRRVKNHLYRTYLTLQWLSMYVLFGYLFVSLADIGSESPTDGRGFHLLGPNNTISDLLPTPVANLQHYLDPLRRDRAQNSTLIGRSVQRAEDFSIDTQAHIAEEATTTSKEQPKPVPTSTDVAYIDWIDRALGWKGSREP